MSTPWRLLVHNTVDGALNMAVDRAIQIGREEGTSPPTLRLYRWSRPTVTLGRFQNVESVDLSECRASGADVVRRSTGGRGVLHDDELTYSVVASLEDGVPRGTAASYAHLCVAIVETYRCLGIDASLTSRQRGVSGSAACYLQTTRADVSFGAAKLSGSAQVWHGSTVLQHGSFTVTRDTAREGRIFCLDSDQRSQLSNHTVTIEEALRRRVTDTELLTACVEGFERGLGVQLYRSELTAEEALRAGALVPRMRIEDPELPTAGG
ncbi:MAG: hypothetical protein CVT67_00240 [Actinobacteria bacterium HGW-Actinobacteria-7]|jgi:lipoate-protein ligase A|nr:MAG: hypothetical protein CVT67_00240 [Actinobacteria bacterium HGW-Actinobacteria-7]